MSDPFDAGQLLLDELYREPASPTDPLPVPPGDPATGGTVPPGDPATGGTEKIVVAVSGRVTRLFFSSPEFSAGRIFTDDGKEVAFSGPLMVKVHDQVTLRGCFERHERYGMQLKAESFEFRQDLSSRGLIELLSNHPSFRGVGAKTARKLAEVFGADFGRALEEEPARVAEAAGKPLREVELWRSAWMTTREVNQTMTWLSSLGVTYKQVCKLVDTLGNSCRAALEKDPYLIIPRVPGFGWKRADELARALGIDGEHAGRVRGAILHTFDQALEAGSTAVTRTGLISHARKLLSERSPVSTEAISAGLEELIGSDVVSSVPLPSESAFEDPFNKDEMVGLSDLYEKEVGVRDFFREMGGRRNPNIDELSMLLEDVPTDDLKARQLEALEAACSSQALLLTGSAGSGKTFTVKEIVGLYETLDLKVRLAAPTGKAARRLEEVTGRAAETIHRLLEWKGKFERNPESPLEADAIIIDEVSMLDSKLAWHLFRAIDVSRTALVLVGDPNQLPPVGAGNVLRDLARRRFIRHIELDEVVRQAGILKENSSALLRGEVRPNPPAAHPPETEQAQTGGTPWILARGKQFFQPRDARNYVLKLYREVLQEKLGFDIVQDVQLLTPRHDGPLGTEELNTELQAIVQWKLYKREVPPMKGGQKKPRPMLYDRVIQTRNNYELDVMNGSVGVVMKETPFTVNYGDGTRDGDIITYDKGSVHEVELAYALTVHKSQGSEFPCAIVVLHSAHGFMLHRGLFYTGVTRARKTAVIVGDPGGVAQAAAKVEVDRRRTFLQVI